MSENDNVQSEEVTDTTTETSQVEASATDANAEADKWKALSRKNEDRMRANAEEAKVLRDKLAKQDAVLKQLAEKAGVTLEPETADESNAKLAQAQAKMKTQAIENAVIRKAQSAGVDADALLDSRAFVQSLANLDPDASDFSERVSDALKDAASNPRYKTKKTQPSVQNGGGDFGGSPTVARQWTKQDAINASPADLDAAIQKGLLKNIGIGPRTVKPRTNLFAKKK
jgi:hypothetical protein